MPKKYHIEVHPAAHRFPPIGRSGIVDWGEGCLRCAQCVKLRCVYNAYRERTFSPDILGDTIDQLCKNCFRCVQGCPKRLIHKTINPEWEALGDDVYTPEIITATWAQAETGKIPVSGAGYGGPFAGPGFDSLWTDMSEIVRPTRDGIHGREYISTVVDIGYRPDHLEFDANGNLVTEMWQSFRVPLPVLFDTPPFGDLSQNLWRGFAMAAQKLGTLMIVPESVAWELTEFSENLVPILGPPPYDEHRLRPFRLVQIADGKDAVETKEVLKAMKPDILVSVRMAPERFGEEEKRVVELVQAGFDLLHFATDTRGYVPSGTHEMHVKDVVRKLHKSLVKHSLRDRTTFMVSGGIAMAEHVIKAMLCGVDLVAVDIPLLVALECRVCRNCREGGTCPVKLSEATSSWTSQRVVNLMGAWHNQFLEMMGAMGIREARRLRGEQGRVMFMEDLERETFARLFSGKSEMLSDVS